MPLFNPASSAADHIADTDDAHDASAISIADSGGYTSQTTVEGALQEIYGLKSWTGQVVKASSESVTSSTTLQDDDELLFTVVNAGSYYFELILLYDAATGSGTPDLKHDCALNGGATFSLPWRQHVGIGTAGAIQQGQVADMTTVITNGTATARMLHMHGAFTVATSDGTFVLRWAQNTSDANATRVLAGSVLRYRRLA